MQQSDLFLFFFFLPSLLLLLHTAKKRKSGYDNEYPLDGRTVLLSNNGMMVLTIERDVGRIWHGNAWDDYDDSIEHDLYDL